MDAILRKPLWFILAIVAVLKATEAILSTSYNDPDFLCYGGKRDEVRKCIYFLHYLHPLYMPYRRRNRLTVWYRDMEENLENFRVHIEQNKPIKDKT